MNEPPAIDRRRVFTSYRCRCQQTMHVVAAAIVADDERWAHFHLTQAVGPLAAGERITACPSCGTPLPALTWSAFEERLGDAWGA